MLKVLKWIGIALAGLVGLLLVLVLALFMVGRGKAATAPDVATRSVAIPTDTASITRGRHIAQAITGCEVCHGPGLSGKAFPTPSFLVSMAAPNLTRGQGGVGGSYAAADWDRAIRHGVGKDGRRLIIMPSEAYNFLNDADAAALIAYIQSLPAVDQSFPARKIGVLGGVLTATGAMLPAVDVIAHDSVGARPVVAPVMSAEYGGYLASAAGCKVCHGADLRGVQAQGGPGPTPSLVAFIANNSAEAFRTTLRTGKTPSGRALNPENMPWTAYGQMTDAELEAIRLYVLSLVSRSSN